MKKNIYILGNGQFANFTFHLIKDLKKYKFSGYIIKENTKKKFFFEEKFFLKKKRNLIFPAIGNLNLRLKVIKKIIDSKNIIPNIIHPSARINKSAKFKSIMATYNSFISNNVSIGDYSIIGTGSFIHHDTIVGKNCLIGGGTHIGAGVTVGDNVLFGIGSSVASKKIKIGNNSIIASGASILSDIPPNYLAIGNPAKLIKIK